MVHTMTGSFGVLAFGGVQDSIPRARGNRRILNIQYIRWVLEIVLVHMIDGLKGRL